MSAAPVIETPGQAKAFLAIIAVGLLAIGWVFLRPANEDDAGAVLACRALRETAADYETLTRDELRGRLRGIDRHARVSDESEVREASREMLVAVTDGDDVALGVAVQRMDRACTDLGR